MKIKYSTFAKLLFGIAILSILLVFISLFTRIFDDYGPLVIIFADMVFFIILGIGIGLNLPEFFKDEFFEFTQRDFIELVFSVNTEIFQTKSAKDTCFSENFHEMRIKNLIDLRKKLLNLIEYPEIFRELEDMLKMKNNQKRAY
jgi:hypothetical protein